MNDASKLHKRANFGTFVQILHIGVHGPLCEIRCYEISHINIHAI